MRPAHDFLIVKLAAAGDVLLTTALARALRQARPESGVAWLTSAYAAPLLERNPDVDEVLTLPTAVGWRARAAAVVTASAKLRAWRRRHPRVTVLLAHRSRWLWGWLRAAGFDVILSWGREAPFDPRRHRLEQQHGLLRATGIGDGEVGPLQPRLQLDAEERAAGERAWGAGTPRWAVAPGGGHNPWSAMPNRRWPPEGFASLGRRARAAGITVRWVAGPGEDSLIRAVAPDLARSEAERSSRRSLRETAGIIAAANLVIGNDSLPLVMAQALGRRALGLYGPTVGAAIHAPRQPYLQGRAGCGPCYDPRQGRSGRAYTCPRARCMEQITVTAAWELARGAVHA